MTDPERLSTREIARVAVRDRLAEVGFELFHREGFDRVTVNDLAAAAGVGRSTFLRYFTSKEDVVLGALETEGQRLAAALAARPGSEDEWTALRRGLDVIVEPYLRDPAKALALTQLILRTPALSAHSLEKQQSWRPRLVAALSARSGATELALSVRAAAALDCLNVAVELWAASDGQRDLVELLDGGFEVLRPR
ncbi:TetR family transcriptional regulator [Nocardia aurantia]|uniref:Putative mycofactocin biosynthesis transcriptional regulator MftR n=1 Tax=Nocardia aurantia TaxID=2585199 RepID=A0A7K0DIT4_9NOCA|nr:TetR family transcriptional regulator [Nocardia aurantia]MQY25713.1 putative mycofactocin biosynthesis transcriptional regulator MftR [Nocardia aurantia]